MLLSKYQGTQYKCVEDSGEVLVDSHITRLVGQNEAGKTALLELLHNLNPVSGKATSFILEDYPRGKLSEYKRTHSEKPHTPIRAYFEIQEYEKQEIEKKFGPGVLASTTVALSKPYGDTKHYRHNPVNEAAYVKHFVSTLSIGEDIKGLLFKATSIVDLKTEIAKLSEEQKKLATGLVEDLGASVYALLDVPQFFYFDEYATLPGEISLKKLKQYIDTEDYNQPDAESMETSRALIALAGSEVDEFLNKDNYERLKADLEAASNALTDTLRKYWKTNQNLEIRFDLEPKLSGSQLVDTILHVRVYNSRHRVTVPFGKRSKGFVWFFSFLAAFSQLRDRNETIILLLDEPGMNLGAVAQRDLMRYFDEELSEHHQVIYTTHSPFMIDPRQLETIRTVEDEARSGTRVSNDPCKHNAETLFPLQAALGYDLAQTFFVAPNNLLVEGAGDLIYFNLMSQVLRNEGRTTLSDDWTPVPVGGADKVVSFVSLLGAQGLNLAVFMDITQSDKQRFEAILKNKLMLKSNLITVGSVIAKADADIEDMFSRSSYLKLVSRSYAKELGRKELTEEDVNPKIPRVVKAIEDYFTSANVNNGKFNHYKPAYDLMMNPDWISDFFDAETKSNFEKAFIVLNNALISNQEEALNTALPVKMLQKKKVAVASEQMN